MSSYAIVLFGIFIEIITETFYIKCNFNLFFFFLASYLTIFSSYVKFCDLVEEKLDFKVYCKTLQILVDLNLKG